LSLQRGWESLDFAYQSFLLRFDSAEQAGFLEALGLGNIRKTAWYWILGSFGLLFSGFTFWSAGRFQKKTWREIQWKKLNALGVQLGKPLVQGEGLLDWKKRIADLTSSGADPTLKGEKKAKWLQMFDEYIRKSYS
ncbi:MAG: hypothetical protein K2X47_00990, partial [Bdellovibrionales bacterium]|nr:hypothetical protein [Bdellovibrionales bacterium]